MTPTDSPAPRLLDWRHASVGDPTPCVLCGRPALMRDPDTKQPKHKVCAEEALTDQPASTRPARRHRRPALDAA